MSESTKTKILDEAQKRQKKLTNLVNELDAHPHPSVDGTPLDLDSEAKLLKGIIDHEIGQLKLSSISALKLEHLHQIQDDFVQLYDFYSGRYRRELENIVLERGEWFLAGEERTAYAEIPADKPAERNAFLLAKGAVRLNPLWHFAVSISRLLQSQDYWISPNDAYWLGLVDEVVGSSMLCVRVLQEEASKQQAKTDEAKSQPNGPEAKTGQKESGSNS